MKELSIARRKLILRTVSAEGTRPEMLHDISATVPTTQILIGRIVTGWQRTCAFGGVPHVESRGIWDTEYTANSFCVNSRKRLTRLQEPSMVVRYGHRLQLTVACLLKTTRAC